MPSKNSSGQDGRLLMSRDMGNTGLHKKWGEERGSGGGERIRGEKKKERANGGG